ncbi:hypothetical protein SAMN05444680_116124 [Variovorax sp. YR216]|nr:hypothetical protein SAMN05444680_116124 [Variovorax sp. YR216]
MLRTECANCGSKEHASSDCPHGLFRSKCAACGSKEHATADCPHAWFRSQCAVCGSKDHATASCPHAFHTPNAQSAKTADVDEISAAASVESIDDRPSATTGELPWKPNGAENVPWLWPRWVRLGENAVHTFFYSWFAFLLPFASAKLGAWLYSDIYLLRVVGSSNEYRLLLFVPGLNYLYALLLWFKSGTNYFAPFIVLLFVPIFLVMFWTRVSRDSKFEAFMKWRRGE